MLGSCLLSTYGLEMNHGVMNSFAPKNTHFFYPAMMARLFVSVLHLNENLQRLKTTSKDVVARSSTSQFNNLPIALSEVNKITYTNVFYTDNVDILRMNLCKRRRQLPSYTQSNDDAFISLGNCPSTNVRIWGLCKRRSNRYASYKVL